MDRRQFIKIAIVSVGAVVVGCGPRNNDDNSSTNNTNNQPGACDDALQPGEALFPLSVASGDPTESTVIVWTKLDDPDADGDLSVELEIALDEEFTERFQLDGDACSIVLDAEERFDHCVKARLTGLEAGTHYYYRFVYEKDGARYVSRVGRTRTAPPADADVPVRFAFVSCQDFNGKYFNTYKRLNEEELDFVVHLGDYVYETTADPLFQMSTPERALVFDDPAGAIVFNEGTDSEFRAAKSLSNYRDLYRTFRADPELQRAHERYPFVVIWDDHEFSDDCYGATATYFDGAEDERDVERRKNANQAWFEYMPVDYLDSPDFTYDRDAEYPGDIRIYRDLRFGANVHLVMTDLRTYRADHVIPEDLFPGALLVDQAALEAEVGELPAWADPYVDIDTFDGGSFATLLTDNAADFGFSAADVTGNISATFVNSIVASLNEDLPVDQQIAPIDTTGLDAGITGYALGKLSSTSSLGSRYFVAADPFDVYAKIRFSESNGASENMLGDDQEAWFLDTMQSSDATWKVWGNEFCLVQRFIDLTTLSGVVGEAFARKYQLSAEDWDGCRYKRDELISQLSDVGGVVAITGDIHAFFAGTPFVSGDPDKRIVELVTAAVSSSTFKTLLINQSEADPALREANASTLAQNIENFLFFASKPNPPLAYADTDVHGFALVEADSAELRCTFLSTPENNATSDLTVDEAGFDGREFIVRAGANDLFSPIQGTVKRWDPTTASWVE